MVECVGVTFSHPVTFSYRITPTQPFSPPNQALGEQYDSVLPCRASPSSERNYDTFANRDNNTEFHTKQGGHETSVAALPKPSYLARVKGGCEHTT